ncbi:MAG: SRPBCC domain-containing protein [Myxococcota bacterium]
MTPDPLTLEIRAEGDRQIVLERRFEAGPSKVYAAFTDPKKIRRWLSTPEWPMRTCMNEAREEGAIRYEWFNAEAPEKTMGMTGRYLRVDPPRFVEPREVFDEDWTGGEVQVRTEFLEDGTGTLLRMTMRYSTQEARDAVLKTGMARGMDLNFYGLDEVLSGRDRLMTPDPERDLVLQRILDASPSRVWAAWTQPELIAQWFAPAPWSVARATVEPFAGGAFSVVMQSPEGEAMAGEPGCVLMALPNRLFAWTDGLGPGFQPKSDSFFTAFVRLRPHHRGTRYQILVRHADADGRARHEAMGFHQGWGKAADQLATLLGER